MNKQVSEKLDAEILRELKILETYEPDQDGYEEAVDGVAKLYKAKTEEDKDKKDRRTRGVLTILEIGVPIVFYGFWMKKGFEFEKDGAITSTTFRNLIGKFKPVKK